MKSIIQFIAGVIMLVVIGAVAFLAINTAIGADWRKPRPRPKPTPAPAPIPAPVPNPGQAKLLYDADLVKLSNIRTAWPLDMGANSGTSPGEVQYYTDLQAGKDRSGGWPNPFTLKDGACTITAFPWQGLPNGKQYLSGVLSTASKFSFTYGYVEAQCKMPGGKGFWPTVWMMRDMGDKDATWPPEVDIVQCSSRIANEYYPAVLTGLASKPKEFGKFVAAGFDMAAAFHSYGFEWTAAKLNWYCDGKLVMSCATPDGMNKAMYVQVSLAVGDDGDWIRKPDGSTQSLSIRSLKVWDKKP